MCNICGTETDFWFFVSSDWVSPPPLRHKQITKDLNVPLGVHHSSLHTWRSRQAYVYHICTDEGIKMDECINQRSVNQHWFLPCLGQNGNVSAQGLGPRTEQILMNLGNTDFANHHLLIQQVDRQQEHRILQTYNCAITLFWLKALTFEPGTKVKWVHANGIRWFHKAGNIWFSWSTFWIKKWWSIAFRRTTRKHAGNRNIETALLEMRSN